MKYKDSLSIEEFAKLKFEYFKVKEIFCSLKFYSELDFSKFNENPMIFKALNEIP